MIKKIMICTLICLFSFDFSCNICASEFLNTKDYLKINVPSAIVMDNDTHRILFEKNIHEKRSIASLTKVMTCIMLVENCNLDDVITTPDSVTRIGGSLLGLKPNDKVTAYNLLIGMLLPSGNDAAYTAGMYIGGTIEKFGEMMTEKAKNIGALNSNFKNPHGLDTTDHYSTAYDMALITSYALENEVINKIIDSSYLSVTYGNTTKTLKNTNVLIRQHDYVDGVKTGFTGEAGRCLITSGTQNDLRLIAVVLGADDTQTRFNTGKNLLEESFKIYNNIDLSNMMNWHIKVPVIKGDKDFYEKDIVDFMSYPLMEDEIENIYVKQEVIKKINAPMDKGVYIGNIKIFLGYEQIYSKDIFLEEDICKKTTIGYFKDCLNNIFKKGNILDVNPFLRV